MESETEKTTAQHVGNSSKIIRHLNDIAKNQRMNSTTVTPTEHRCTAIKRNILFTSHKELMKHENSTASKNKEITGTHRPGQHYQANKRIESTK